MKPTISKVGQYWRLLYYRPAPASPSLQAVNEFYIFYEGAWERLAKLKNKLEREQKALRFLKEITMNFLSVRDYQFICHMDQTKCRDITKRQYGYLKGVWERQR